MNKTKTRKLNATTERILGDGPAHHFFASSAGAWRVAYDVAELADALAQGGTE